MALGLNITLGFAGLLDIGFAVYYGAGAYTSAQFAIHFGTNFWLGLALGGLSASLFGFVVAWPALRVHDHYLGLVTLGYGLMMNLLARNLNFLTNGTDGVINIPPPSIGSFAFTQSLKLGPLTLPFQANFYYLAMAIALLTAFVSYRLRQSPLGRSWDAIREDEIAARCSGVNTRGVKILAFSTGAFFGGIGGAIYAHMIGFISPENFSFLESITIMVMVVIGGAGNIMGVAIGAVILVVLPERFREFEHLRLLFFGAALVLLMINRPEGLFPRLRMRRVLPAGKLAAVLAQTRDRIAGVRGVKSTIEYVIMGTDLLRIEHLTKNFGGIYAVNDLNMLVGKGEIVAVIGPNGSGKTTLFNLIVHLYDSNGRQDLFRRSASRHREDSDPCDQCAWRGKDVSNAAAVSKSYSGRERAGRHECTAAWWPAQRGVSDPTHKAKGRPRRKPKRLSSCPYSGTAYQHVQRAG